MDAHQDTGTAAVTDVMPNVCKTGVMQSPINLHTCKATVHTSKGDEEFNIPNERPELKISYGADGMELEKVCPPDSDHGCELKVTPKSDFTPINMLEVPGGAHSKKYTLTHCVVRIPAEHTVNGRKFPLEVQCHHNMDGHGDLSRRKGILSTLYMVGRTSENDETTSGFLSFILPKMPTWDTVSKTSTKTTVFPAAWEPTGSAGMTRYHSYAGSQTTGQCTEDVDWYVMYDPTGLTQAQFNILKTNMTDNAGGWANARPVQNNFGREPAGCPEHHGEPGNAPIAAGLSTLAIALSASLVFA